jgi:hypothetical protein
MRRAPASRSVIRTSHYLERVGPSGSSGGEEMGVVIVAESSEGVDQIAELYRYPSKAPECCRVAGLGMTGLLRRCPGNPAFAATSSEQYFIS